MNAADKKELEDGVAAARGMLAGCSPGQLADMKGLAVLGEAMVQAGLAAEWLVRLLDLSRSLRFVVLVTGGDEPRYEVMHEANPDAPLVIAGEKAVVMRDRLQSVQAKLAKRGMVPPPRVDDLVRATILATMLDAAKTM